MCLEKNQSNMNPSENIFKNVSSFIIGNYVVTSKYNGAQVLAKPIRGNTRPDQVTAVEFSGPRDGPRVQATIMSLIDNNIQLEDIGKNFTTLIRQRSDIFKEDLIAAVWHPERYRLWPEDPFLE
jgi:hypothetical protein